MKLEVKIEEERNKLNKMIAEGTVAEEVLEQSEIVDRYIVKYMKGA